MDADGRLAVNGATNTIRRELAVATLLPYRSQLSGTVLHTANQDFLFSFRLAGCSFETADDVQLNVWHERLNVLWRNIAQPQVSLWTHVVRRRVGTIEKVGGSGSGFADRLHHRYQERLGTTKLMQNELYLTVVFRPALGAVTGPIARALRRSDPERARGQIREGLDACGKLATTISAALARYEPQALEVYHHGGRWHSELLEFLGLLLNANYRRVPLPTGPVNEILSSARLRFGTEVIEYRGGGETRLGAVLGIQEYTSPVAIGSLNRLLSAPFEFVLTQSFTFLSKTTGQRLLERQINRMANAGDLAVSQVERMQQALDALTSNEFVMGDHHFTLQVLTDPVPGTAEESMTPLNERLSLARALLADTGVTVAREDMALEPAFWAQLPGIFALRPRKAPITSRNFAAMVPFLNYPGGREDGNHWGRALALLATSAQSPYHFSLHASDPTDPDGGSRRDAGHTFICGPTGSGKTVFIGFLIALLSQRGVTQIVFDKDRGLEILIRALGGEYLPLRNGVPTGFNPMRLSPTPENIEFLKGWLMSLSGPAADPTSAVRERADLDQALHGTLALAPAVRRLSRLVEFLDPTLAGGLYARLARWCAGQGGDYAWVFDSAEDDRVAAMGQRALVGFDVTQFLDSPVIRGPVTRYLFHLVRQWLDGRQLVCWMDEFWRLLEDPAFAEFAKDGPKTWRKLNAVMCLATQSASDVLQSPISRTIIEQTPTKVFFPNTEANLDEYTQQLGLSEREFRLIRERLEPGARQFLVKQGHHSVVCELDLKGFTSELRVISGRAREIEHMQRCMALAGVDPDAWLPLFLQNSAGD